ncbi:MAG: hypothetical protein FWE34_05830 [Defluviitaleaceae bacterium]|nr:hypothetical protein [Defluviitaleaceae bacterium]
MEKYESININELKRIALPRELINKMGIETNDFIIIEKNKLFNCLKIC